MLLINSKFRKLENLVEVQRDLLGSVLWFEPIIWLLSSFPPRGRTIVGLVG